MKFQISYFFLAHYLWQHSLAPSLSVSLPTVTDPLLDRDMDIFSSSRGPSGRVYGPCGNHSNGDGNWSEKDVPLWSCSTCLDPGTLICFVSPSLTFLCPISLEDPPPPHFYLTFTTFSSLCPSSSFFSSLHVSPVPGKVIGGGISMVEMKVAMTKGWGICCNITLDPLVFFPSPFSSVPACFPPHSRYHITLPQSPPQQPLM